MICCILIKKRHAGDKGVMIKRRTTLKIGLSGALASAFPLQSFAASKQAAARTDLTDLKVLYNSNYAESRNLAASMHQQQIQLEDMAEDLAALWYGKLKPELAQRPGILFGLGDRVDLFCIEELARDFGMKTVFRLEHLFNADGSVIHLNIKGQTDKDVDRLLTTVPGFGYHLTELVPLALQNSQQSIDAHKRPGPFPMQGKSSLVSWMIS